MGGAAGGRGESIVNLLTKTGTLKRKIEKNTPISVSVFTSTLLVELYYPRRW